jgi:hypothetical protein
MGRADYWKIGDWNALCDVCGFKRKASEMKLRWDGLYVCPEDWEPRQPQDFVRGVPDNQTPPWTRPVPPPIFASFCTLQGRSGLAGFAVAGCSIVGLVPVGVYDNVVPTDNSGGGNP